MIQTLTRKAIMAGVAILTLASCLSFNAAAATVITGTLKNKAGHPLTGLALLEKGELHNNMWYGGSLVDKNGHFKIKVGAGGQYGLHVYSSGYIYSPQAVKVETGKTAEVNFVLVAEPTRANDPVIKQISFSSDKLTMEVNDPNQNLGPQVLAFNSATGKTYALAPPQSVHDLKSKFPNGTYQLPLEGSDSGNKNRNWHFVVANHECNTTDIVSYPHKPGRPKLVQE